MKARSTLTWAVGVLLVTLMVLAVVLSSATAGPSVLASGPDGWLAARKYLEARGVETRVRDRPLTADEVAAGDAPAVWVTAFPWQQVPLGSRLEIFRDYVRRGGTLILGTSGELSSEKEGVLLNLLGAPLEGVGPEPPLSPWGWWRFRRRQWTLVPADSAGDARPGIVSAGSALPQPPPKAHLLLRVEEEDDQPAAAMAFPLGQGRVVLVPSAALSNGRLSAAGNADLLEALRTLAPATAWTFDEFVHGLQPPPDGRGLEAPRVAFDLFVGHLGLLYLLALAAWIRRFGPPWQEPPIRIGSAAAFLRSLGSLHHRLGHHGRAAQLLLERTRALDPRRQIPEEVAALASPGDARALLRLARALAQSSAPHPHRSLGKDAHDG